MDIFNRLGKKASQTYQYTAEKTGKIAKETKLRFSINENKSKIDAIYKEMGQKVYEKHIREEDISIERDLLESCSQIDNYAKDIETAKNEILALKDKKQCTKCAYEIEKDFRYCPSCGSRQEDVPDSGKKPNQPNDEEEVVMDGIDESIQEIQPENIETVEESETEE